MRFSQVDRIRSDGGSAYVLARLWSHRVGDAMSAVIVREVAGLPLVRRACEMTMHGQESKVSLRSMYRAEHSPIRCRMFWVEMLGIPSFVSVHLVRHKHGVEHFVQSMRDDLYLDKTTRIDRDTPVNHGMLINAQALVQISRKRLCLKSHKKTIAVWSKVRNAVSEIDTDLADFMVPECKYRNGLCPELRECKPGPAKVCAAYNAQR